MHRVILGIETSCDETSAAILVDRDGVPQLRSLTILSQDVHQLFGGVVPELASRAHLTALPAVIDGALRDADVTMRDVTGIAVTQGPGLIGALLVGTTLAKGLGERFGVPVIGVHHLEGHLFAPTLDELDLSPPFVALLVSGGHTLLVDVEEWGHYRLLGETRDDAAGEAFDKVGSMLELPYPGGPEIERLARAGDPTRYPFPRPMLRDGLEFSFSGLKTAVLHAVRASHDLGQDRADLAASFQAAVIDVLSEKAVRAAEVCSRSTIVLGGGVACNRTLVDHVRHRTKDKMRVSVARPRYNTDNAAMIARAGWFHLTRGRGDPGDFDAAANLPMPGLERGEFQVIA